MSAQDNQNRICPECGRRKESTPELKAGDKVRRILYDNGPNAAVGQEATVKLVDARGFVHVEYPGCCNDKNGAELWLESFVQKVG